jgi:4'-phosphopantetheinyl transferase
VGIILEKDIDNKGRIGIWAIQEQEEELLERLIFNESEQIFVDSIKNKERRMQWLASRVLLKHLLDEKSYVNVEIDNHQRPFLTNKPHSFSISHCGNMAAVSVSQHYNTGLDIENLNPKVLRIAKKYIHPDEWYAFDPTNIEQLTTAWAIKETVYKLNGKKQVSLKDHIRIAPFKGKEGKTIIKFIKPGAESEATIYYERLGTLVIAYCFE